MRRLAPLLLVVVLPAGSDDSRPGERIVAAVPACDLVCGAAPTVFAVAHKTPYAGLGGTDHEDTLIWKDRVARPRTREALGLARAAGMYVIVVTGRMVHSLERVLPLTLLSEPAICYQAAVVVDTDGTWLRHVPIET